MRIAFISILFLFVSLKGNAQKPVGSWSEHLSYYSSRGVAVTPTRIYSSNGSSILVLDRNSGELSKLSKVQGLSGTGISCIAWSAENKALVIAYNNTDIDIVKENSIINIPDVKRKYIPGKKEISKIRTSGKYAYLACSFGIVVLDLSKGEIFDTWKPGDQTGTPEVYDVDISTEKVYAATSTGLYMASVGDPGLSYFGNWTLFNGLPVPNGICRSVIVSGNKVYYSRRLDYSYTDSIFVIDNGVSLLYASSGITFNSFDHYPGGFTLNAKQFVFVYSAEGALLNTISSYNPGSPDIQQSVVDGQDIWIADKSKGLIKGQGMSVFQVYNLPAPYNNDVAYITSRGGRTFITGGLLDNAWNNVWRPLELFTSLEGNWHSEISYDLHDPMRVLPDPLDNSHYWVSTWGHGLLEYKDDSLINFYDDSNSPLQTIIPGKPYSRICGLALDDDRNLWITQTGVQNTIKILKPDKTWIVNPITVNAPTIGDILITKNGLKWIVLPRGYGLFVLDDNGTPDKFSDDRYKQFLIKDIDNHVISTVYSIAEDLDGSIWLGTDQGPAIYYTPDRIFDDDPRATRIKVPRNDGTGLADYMLGTEIITSVAVDGANRKWLGTFSSGAYLLSADGNIKIANYNEDNSPIFSNTVVSVAVDDKTGEVWFGTSSGVLSIRGDATAGSDAFRDVYSFPNPVRENYQGNVTITGLMRNTQVRITDVSGNLVYSMVSDGGEASWDLTTYNGKRVATGVYLVFCASEDGTQSCVIKMLVIH